MHARWILLVALTAALAALPGRVKAADGDLPCDDELSVVTSGIRDLPRDFERRADRRLQTAIRLWRFHRGDDAFAKLDSLARLVNDAPARPQQGPKRTALRPAIDSLRACLAATQPPDLATLTIRTLVPDGSSPGFRSYPAPGGAFVDVEGARVGETGPDGMLTVKVPPGTIHVTAVEYPSTWGEAFATLEAGGRGTAAVVLQDSKEPGEDTDLVLVEAVHDILPLEGDTFTLKFVRDGVDEAVEEIDSLELEDSREDRVGSLADDFAVSDGAIVARDPAAVYERIAAASATRPALSIRVHATDRQGRTHDGVVPFQVGRSKLTVTLAPPPSNPTLAVAGISVSVTVMGADVALSRVSDANGRFEIAWLPHATLAFHAETQAGGLYYYADASLSHEGHCSVTVVLRHVSDLVKNVPGLRRDPGCAPPPPLAR